MDDDLSVYTRLVDILPEGATPVAWVASFEYLGADGQLHVVHRMSEDNTPWKALGMVTSLTDDLRDSLRTPAYVVDEEDDE
jgi:hypothetical protein